MTKDEIIQMVDARVASEKERYTLNQMMDRAELAIGMEGSSGAYQTFQEAIRQRGLSVIAELQAITPASGTLDEDSTITGSVRECEYDEGQLLDIAYDYESGSADAVSVVIEPRFFGGSEELFQDVRDEVSAPLVWNDLIIDEYQLYQAKSMGADAVVLNCALLSDEQLLKMLQICNDLHFDALVEAHDEAELQRAIKSQALIIGVSCTPYFGLPSAACEVERICELRKLVPDNRLFVAMYGVLSVDDAKRARDAGADAVMVSSMLMNCTDGDERQKLLYELKEIE